MKKIVSYILLLVLLTLALSGCGQSAAPAAKLSFKEAASLETLKQLDGKKVTITGYMATISPLDGSYIYLMNLPYQSCPFCVPNTQQLSNTLAVYAADGSSFSYTDRPVKIEGTMKIEDYVDDYGYSYNYRIVNAKYELVDMSAVSEEYALYQSLAADGTLAEINAMFDYLSLVCQWTEYSAGYQEDGETPYYLQPEDVKNILSDEYGYARESAEDYFPSLVKSVEAISKTKLTQLTDILTEAQALEQYARSELENESYTVNAENGRYVLTNDAELYNRFMELYIRFSEWLTQYEL